MTASPTPAADWPTACSEPPVPGRCRFCGTTLHHTMVDLGMSPLCESYVSADRLNAMEPFYPLRVQVCSRCFLVQLDEYVSGEAIFTEYAYFSSFSDSWLDHSRRYVEQMIARLGLDAGSRVIEVASNDGYLLQYFAERGIPVLGVEPAANVARTAVERGVPTLVEFFGRASAQSMAAKGQTADLLLGNNVLAQVPDLNDFVGGLRLVLASKGTITIEFPHLLRTIEGNQFDQVYHEHFCYFSLYAVERIFAAQGLTIFDLEELSTHGGSLRIYARHTAEEGRPLSPRLLDLRRRELDAGINSLAYYAQFEERVRETKRKLLEFLIEARRAGKRVVGYGAPGKGNTLLNYCGIRTDFIEFTVDKSPYKQGRFLPGTHIPILHPDRLAEARPDYVVILPWNLREEIMAQLGFIRDWGGRFVIPIPEATVYP